LECLKFGYPQLLNIRHQTTKTNKIQVDFRIHNKANKSDLINISIIQTLKSFMYLSKVNFKHNQTLQNQLVKSSLHPLIYYNFIIYEISNTPPHTKEIKRGNRKESDNG